jgi:hypothetical protein
MEMDKIENHMVAQSQPELDREYPCNHDEWTVVEIEDTYGWSEDYIDFKIVCDSCGKDGYRSYNMKFIDVEWD